MNMTASDRLSLANRVVRQIEGELRTAARYREDYKSHAMQRRINLELPDNTFWASPSDFEVHGWKQETDERRQYVYRKPNPKKYRDDQVKLTAYEPNEDVDTNALTKSMPPNFVHSIDASVIHKCLAYTPDEQSLVCVHDALGTHLRHVDDARQRFKQNFHRVYSHQHPVLSVFDANPLPDPTSKAKPDGTPLLTDEFLAQLYHQAPHMI